MNERRLHAPALSLGSISLDSLRAARFATIVGALLIASAVSPPQALADHREAKIYGATEWNSTCSGNTRSDWDDMVDAWYDAIGGSSWYRKSYRLINGSIKNSKFADATKVAWGADSSYIDAADAVMLFWHGLETGDKYRGTMRVDEAGDGNCEVRSDEMDLGDGDLEFLALSSCNSLDDNQWTEWRKSFKGLHQLDGFHGLMWIAFWRAGDYESFAEDAFDDNIADAWLDNLYHTDIGWDGVDQCPVAYGVGNGITDLWNRIDRERYDNIFSDPTDHTHWGATFIIGCNPAAESVVDSDRSE